MMLHRHFESEKQKNVTTLSDVTPTAVTEDDFDIHAPLSTDTTETPKRGRPKKTDNTETE